MSNKLKKFKKLVDEKPTPRNYLMEELEFIKSTSIEFREKWDSEIIKLSKQVK